jgi:hypothetical protein
MSTAYITNAIMNMMPQRTTPTDSHGPTACGGGCYASAPDITGNRMDQWYGWTSRWVAASSDAARWRHTCSQPEGRVES